MNLIKPCQHRLRGHGKIHIGNRVFTTSLGHAKDFANQNALRVIVNGVFWSAGRPVPSAETVLNTFSISAK